MAFLPKVKKYIDNMGKTAKYIAISEFNEAMPIFEATRESNEDLIRDTRNSFKQKRFFREIYKQSGVSEVFKSGNELLKNAKTSLKTGEFYNKSRAKKASDQTLSAIAGFDLSDLDNLDFGDEDESENDLNNQGDAFKSLESDLETGFEANAEAVSQSVLTSAEYTAETIKGAASLSYSQSMKQLQAMRMGFGSLNKGIGTIIKFNQDQLQKHIANSTQFFDSTTKLLTEQNAVLKEMLEMQRNLYKAARTKDVNRREDPLEEILNPYTGGINLKAYGKAVKGNLENNAWFMMGKMMWDMRHEIIANPIEFIMRNILNAIGGDKVKGKLEQLQKTLVGSLATMNARLLKTAKTDNGILGTIASILGIEAPDRARVDTGKFEKGPMQFNGAANKAITEVIPTYLARIEAALTGSPAKFYNMETGKWNTAKELKESLNKEKNERDLDDFKEKFRDILAEFGTFTGAKQKEIEEAYDAMYKQIVKNEGLVSSATYKKITDNKEREKQKSKYKEEMGLTGASDEIVELFSQIMDHQAMQSTRNQLALNVRNKKGSNADLVARIMSDPNSPYNLLVNGALRDTTDAVFTDIDLSTGLTKDKHKKAGHHEVNLLNANRDILINMNKELYYIRNILQFGREAFKGGLSGGSLGGNLKIPSISKDESKIGYGLNFNFQEDIAEKIDRPSSRLFTKMNVDEFANIDSVFKKLIDLVDPNDNLDSLNTKLNEEASRILRTSIVQYVTRHYDELIENLDENDDYNLIYFYKSIVNGVVQDSNKSNELWNINKNPFLRAICREIIRYKNPSTKSGDATIKNKKSVDDALNNLIEKEKEKTSKEKLDKFSGNGFFEKFKNAKGLDKLSVIKHQLGSFIDAPVNFISNALDSLNNGIYNIANGNFDFSSITNGFNSLTNKLTGKAYGDKNLNRSGLYVLSKGEAVIPSHLNPWNPNRSNADPRRDAISENNLLARLSQSGVPISGSFATGTAVVDPSSDNRNILEKAIDWAVSAGDKVSVFIDSHTGNAITVTKDQANEIIDKAQEKTEELKEKASTVTGKVLEYFKNTFSDTLGRGAGGALIGGLLTGGNPMGILLGGSVSILMGMAKKSNIITDTLFGNNFDKQGLAKYIPESIKKQAKNMKDYGIAGSIVGLGMGAIGGPFGLLGGALLGSTVGYLKDNDEAKTLLFGPGLGENIKKLFKTKENLKYTTVGATVGGLVGGPLGVVGGALVGGGLSFITTSEKFKEMMFGKKEGDKVVKEGLLQKMDRFFGDGFKDKRESFAKYIKEAITEPIEKAMVPVGTALQVGVREAVKGLQNALKKFVQADISSRWGRLGQSIQKNKWMSGAVGGALGGMMMGGPLGGILGGVLGSVAHGTGADAKLFELGKNISLLPGKGLKFVSNKLAKWEINSGNGFNWTAQERLDMGGDNYKNTSYGKADTALSKMNKSELIMLQSLIKGIDDLDGATKYAMEELMRAIDRVLAVSGLSITEQDNIKEMLADKKEKTKIVDINKIIENSNSIGLTRKTEVIEELKPRLETFISTMAYVESLKDRGVRDAAIKEAANKLGIDESELQDKDKREKFTMYSAKEIANRDGKEKINIEAQDVTTQAGDKVVDALGYNVTRLMNFMRLLQKDYLKGDDVKVYFDAFGNATMYTEIKDENGNVTDIEIKDNELNANSEEEKEKIKEAILGTAENTKQIAENTEEDKDEKKKEVKKPTKTSSIMEALKGVFGTITKPFKELDALISSLPLIGTAYDYIKMKAKTGIKSVGKYLGNKILSPIKQRFGSILNNQREKALGKINDTYSKISGYKNSLQFQSDRDFADWLQGKKALINESDIDTTGGFKLGKKTQIGGKLSNSDKTALKNLEKKIADAKKNKVPLILSEEELKKYTKLETINGKSLNKKQKELLQNAKKLHIENVMKDPELLQKSLKEGVDLKSRTFGGMIDNWSKGISNKYNAKYMSDKFERWYRNTALNLSGQGKFGNWFANKMADPNELKKLKNWAPKIGGAASKAVGYGAKAAGWGAKFLGKWGGKIAGAVFDVIDSMAIANSMNEAADSIQIEEPEQALPIIAKSTASIAAAMPLIGEAIKRNNPNDGIGDLVGAVAENGGLNIGSKLASIGAGITGTVGGIATAFKSKMILAKNTISGGASAAKSIAKVEAAAGKSSVISFIKTIFEKVTTVAKKFLNPETVSKLGSFMGKIVKNVTKPGILTKLAPAIAKKTLQIASGPIGWAIMAGFIAHSFYKGFDDAEKMWNPRNGEEITVFKKALCGIVNVLYNDCLLSIVFDKDQLMNMVKQFFQDPEDNNVANNISNVDDSKSILQKIREAGANAWENMTKDFSNGVGAISEFVTNIKSGISETFGGFINKAKEFGNKVIEVIDSLPFKDGISGLIQKTLEPLKSIYNRIFGKSKNDVKLSDTQIDTNIDTNKTKLTEKEKEILNKRFKTPQEKNELKLYTTMVGRRPRGDGGYFGIGDGGVDNAQRIWDYLSSKGLGSSAIAGIMGNIQQESGFMPDRVQGSGVKTAPEITVDGETGYGLCQWTYKTRQQALKDFAASRGKPSSDLETQLDFMLHEVNQSDSGLLGRMSKMDPHRAAAEFHDSFERSADDAAGVAKRGANAQEIFRKQGRGITTAGTYSAAAAQGNNAGSLSTSSSSSGGIFDSVIKQLEGGALGKLGAALFGSASFFTSGLSGILGGGSAGGAGSSRSFSGASPNIINGKSGCANYKQDDTRWYNAPYSSSTVGRSGCMPTSFCNMASMYGVKVLPPDACTFSADRGCYIPGAGTSCGFYKLASEHWNVPVHACGSWEAIMSDLRQGKPVAGGFEGGGGYSSGGHWMLLTHIDSNGNIYIADSRNNYQGITGPDISGYHPESEVRAHWAGPGYAFGADNIPTVTSTNGNVLDYLQDTLKGNITGKFGEPREGGAHGGVDIATAEGTPILSPINGIVEKVGIEPAGYGNYIQIKDDKGKYHLFGHLKETPKSNGILLNNGNRIKTGQPIGLIGNTGHSTGPHLHYQIDPESNHRALKDGQHIDPTTYTISQDTMSRINENNNSVSDFKRNEYGTTSSIPNTFNPEGNGDGGYAMSKESLEGLKPIDYAQKFDTIIQLLTTMVSLLGGGNKPSNFSANVTNNTNQIPAIAGGGFGGGITNTPKFATTAPGKSIETILTNMIKLAKGN